MPEIEFLGLPDDVDEPATRVRAPRGAGGARRHRLTALLWTGAAAASVGASFATVYSIDAPADEGFERLDGWGRMYTSSAFAGNPHGPRYGIVLVLAAAALLVAAALTLLPRTQDTRTPGAVALVTAGILAGALAAVYLDVHQIENLAERSDVGGGLKLTVSVGALFWWGLAAIALVAAGLSTRRRAAPAAVPDDDADAAPGHPGDESLPA